MYFCSFIFGVMIRQNIAISVVIPIIIIIVTALIVSSSSSSNNNTPVIYLWEVIRIFSIAILNLKSNKT
jgi:hypothetical protein